MGDNANIFATYGKKCLIVTSRTAGEKSGALADVIKALALNNIGYDIFNNHTLIKKEFNVINKLTSKTKNKQFFNTLLDYQRDYSGKEIEDYGFQYDSNNNKFKKHQYQIDNVLTFEESINENLIENNKITKTK